MTKFVKGQSGNPKGRPKGVEDKRTALRKRFESGSNAVAASVIQAALDGDMQAARLVLERISPPIRAKADTVSFELNPEANLTNTARSILNAVSNGEVDPITGKSLLDGVAAMARIQEVTELAARIDYLEANLQ